MREDKHINFAVHHVQDFVFRPLRKNVKRNLIPYGSGEEGMGCLLLVSLRTIIEQSLKKVGRILQY